MKKQVSFYIVAVLLVVGLTQFGTVQQEQDQDKEEEKIQWMSFEEAVEKSKEEKKKVFIDIYTHWCGWCKKMNKTTFSKPEIVNYINENFYPVKLNAERKDTVRYNGRTFVYKPKVGRKGTHELALSLMSGKPAYPTFVILNENFGGPLTIIRGYKRAPQLDPLIHFFGENHYKEQEYEQFKEEYESDL